MVILIQWNTQHHPEGSTHLQRVSQTNYNMSTRSADRHRAIYLAFWMFLTVSHKGKYDTGFEQLHD